MPLPFHPPASTVPVGKPDLDTLAPLPGTEGRYVDVTTGRHYEIAHAVDGTPIRVPLEMTEEEREEIDRKRDRPPRRLWWPTDDGSYGSPAAGGTGAEDDPR
jgi:hypothetical protein